MEVAPKVNDDHKDGNHVIVEGEQSHDWFHSSDAALSRHMDSLSTPPKNGKGKDEDDVVIGGQHDNSPQYDGDNDENLEHQGDREVVAVFNANTPEGGSMVRALSNSGCNVAAIVRVFTSRNTKAFLKMPQVRVKVADFHDEKALARAVRGAHRAFLVTKYWEKFDTLLEEKQAMIILSACASQGVPHLVLSSYEDTKQLRRLGLKSQIVPDKFGTIHPKFEGMQGLKQEARNQGVQLTHMVTSYLDLETSKKSLCLIVGESGKLIVQPNLQEN